MSEVNNLPPFGLWSRRAALLAFLVLTDPSIPDASANSRLGVIKLDGFPNATNTGVPAGTTLKQSNGMVITTPGAVIEGLDIRGMVSIEAPNVTLKNSKLTGSGFGVVLIKRGITGTVVEDCEIDNQGAGGQWISGQGTFLRNNIHDCADGINVRGDNTLIEGNYVHTMRGTPASHFDGIQADGGFSGLTIRNNTVINDYAQTSAVMLDNYWGPIDNVVIENNLLAGGGYTVYLGEMKSGQPGGGPVTNVRFVNNRVSGGYWGPLYLRTELGNMPLISGNRNHLTGGLLPGQQRPDRQTEQPARPGP